MYQLMEQIVELHQNYNDLGEDLVFLEAVVAGLRMEYGFPEEYAESGLERIMDYVRQHAGEVQNISGSLCRAARRRTTKQ